MKTDRKLNTADLASFHHFLHLNLLFCFLYLVDKVRFQPGFRIRIFFADPDLDPGKNLHADPDPDPYPDPGGIRGRGLGVKGKNEVFLRFR